MMSVSLEHEQKLYWRDILGIAGSVFLASHYVFITIVSLALLNSLCLFSFVNIQPKNTSIGSKKALPKLCIAIFLLLGKFPAKSVVFILSSFFPIDWPVVDSKYSQ